MKLMIVFALSLGPVGSHAQQTEKREASTSRNRIKLDKANCLRKFKRELAKRATRKRNNKWMVAGRKLPKFILSRGNQVLANQANKLADKGGIGSPGHTPYTQLEWIVSQKHLESMPAEVYNKQMWTFYLDVYEEAFGRLKKAAFESFAKNEFEAIKTRVHNLVEVAILQKHICDPKKALWEWDNMIGYLGEGLYSSTPASDRPPGADFEVPIKTPKNSRHCRRLEAHCVSGALDLAFLRQVGIRSGRWNLRFVFDLINLMARWHF